MPALDVGVSGLLVVGACDAGKPGRLEGEVGDGDVGRTALDIDSIARALRGLGVHNRPAAQGKS